MKKEIDTYSKARKKVKVQKGFYQHLGYFGAVMIFLLLLNIATFHGHWWIIYPFLGWGLGVLIHYISVFGLPFMDNGEEWEEKAIHREMEKMERRTLPQSLDTEEDHLELPELSKQKNQSTPWKDDDLV